MTALSILLALAVLPCGCDRQPRARSEVHLGYFANVTHAQAVLGVASGEFADAVKPLTLSTRVFNAGPSLIEALLAGEIDIGYVGPGPAISACQRTRGQGICVISGAAGNGVLIVAAKDSGIVTPQDLPGKKIATPQVGNTQDVAARHFLMAVLHQSDTSNVIAVANTDQLAMLARGQIDGAWAPEPWGSRLIVQAGARLVCEEKDLWASKRFPLTVIVTTPQFAAQHRDVVERILAVHSRWTNRLRAAPAKYAAALDNAIAKLTGNRLPAGVTQSALAHVVFTDDPMPGQFQTMANWSRELGFVAQSANLDHLFDFKVSPR